MPQLKEALVSLPSLAAKKLMYYLISPLSPRVLWGHRPAPPLPLPPRLENGWGQRRQGSP